jgi:hypothetical protein
VRAWHTEALGIARILGDRQIISDSLVGLGTAALEEGAADVARTLLEEGLEAAEKTGHVWSIGLAHHLLGQTAHTQGDYALARTAQERCRECWGALDYKQGVGSSLLWQGHVATAQGNYALAQARYVEALSVPRQVGRPRGFAFTLGGFANLAAAQGKHDRAARLAGAAAAICDACGVPVARVQKGGLRERLMVSQATLGAALYDAAYVAGQMMALEEGVAYALEEDRGRVDGLAILSP